MDLPFEGLIHHSAHDDVGFGIDNVVNHLGSSGHVLQGHVLTTADVDHTALGAIDALGFQQRACNRGLGCFHGS